MRKTKRTWPDPIHAEFLRLRSIQRGEFTSLGRYRSRRFIRFEARQNVEDRRERQGT